MKGRRGIVLGALVGSILLLGGCASANVPMHETSKSQELKAESETQTLSGEEANVRRIYEYDSQELYVQRGENQIYGILYIPKDAGEKMPAVIFSHGFGGNYQAGVPYAQELAKRGYVAYCFDFCGGSPGSLSDGSILEMSIFTEQADLGAVMDEIRGLDYVDGDNLFLMGTSQGGAGHGFYGEDAKQAVDFIRNYLETHRV